MQIDRIDHFVLTVNDLATSCDFYVRALGMEVHAFGTAEKPRVALRFGNQKINLHQVDAIPDPNVWKPTPGSADFCLISDEPLDKWIAHLKSIAVTIIQGPVKRTGATGPITSIYVRDPDENLIEIANLD